MSSSTLKGSHCSTNDEGLGHSSTSLENSPPENLKKKELKIERESIKEAIEALEDATNVNSSHDSEIDEGENFDEFSLSDIPEIPSALEKHTERSITPYPRSSTSSSLSSCSSRPSTVNVKPYMLTSGIPRISSINENKKPHVLQHLNEETDDWIRYQYIRLSLCKTRSIQGFSRYYCFSKIFVLIILDFKKKLTFCFDKSMLF